MAYVLNARKLSYQEAIQVGKYPEVSRLVSQLQNKVKIKYIISIFNDVIAKVFEYFQLRGEDLIDKETGRSLHYLEHNLHAALEAIEHSYLFRDKNQLYTVVFLLLVHNLDKDSAKAIVGYAQKKYEERFGEELARITKIKPQLFSDDITQGQREEYFTLEKQKYYQKLPFNIEEGFSLHQKFREYRHLSQIINKPDLDNFSKARLLYSRFKNNKELLYIILIDTISGIKYLANESRQKVATSYLTLKFLSMILSREYEMFSKQQILLEKIWVHELQNAYFEINSTPEEKDFLAEFKARTGVNYFDLYDLGKEFIKDSLIITLKQKIESGEIAQNSVFMIEYRIKSLDRFFKKKEENRNINDLVAFRIVCDNLQDAYAVKSILDADQLNGKEILPEFTANKRQWIEKGYKNAIHSSYQNVLLNKIPIEIQYIGGKEAHIENQRGEKTDYLTVYAVSVGKDVKLDKDLIYVSCAEKCNFISKKFQGAFYEYSEKKDLYDILFDLLREKGLEDLPKRLSAHIITKDGLSSQSISFDKKRYKIKPGEVIVFDSKNVAPSNLQAELKKRKNLILHRAAALVKRPKK